MAGDWRERVLATAWRMLEDCPPRDAAPLLRLIKDVEEGADRGPAESKMDQLEQRRRRRKGPSAG